MEIEQRVKMLSDQLRVKDLITKLPELEAALEKALNTQICDRQNNQRNLAALGSDSPAVKEILASLVPPELKPSGEEGKVVKSTVADREAWLMRQRKENKLLNEAIAKQDMTSFMIENDRVQVEMAREKMVNIRAVLAVRTAQLNFLATSDAPKDTTKQ